MTVSNIVLIKIAKALNLDLSAIIMKDHLKDEQPRGCYIINLQSSNNEGTHWVCLCINKKQAFYFDSFAGEPLPEVIDYCKANKLSLCMNNFIIQNLDSSACGYYCLGIILYLHQNNTKFLNDCNDFINIFDDNTKDNEKLLKQYIKDALKGDYKNASLKKFCN